MPSSPATDSDDDLPRTGHHLHFLSRLQRVDDGQTELALRLYRDPALLRTLLADPACGAQGDRVALPLGEPAESPGHVVITRTGAFVTCLGPEMATTGLPVLPWERMRIHLLRVDNARAANQRADDVLASGDLDRTLERLYFAGSSLTREEFLELSALEPLILTTFWKSLIEKIHRHDDFARTVVRIKRIRPTDEPLLRVFWNNYHAIGHLLLLATQGGKRSFDMWERGEAEYPDLAESLLAYCLTPARRGSGAVALRASWAVARSGKWGLAGLKRALARPDGISLWLTRAVGVLAIAQAHRRLRAEAARVLATGPVVAPDETPAQTAAMARFGKLMAGSIHPLSGDDDTLDLKEEHVHLVTSAMELYGVALQLAETPKGKEGEEGEEADDPDSDPDLLSPAAKRHSERFAEIEAAIAHPLFIPRIAWQTFDAHGGPDGTRIWVGHTRTLVRQPASALYFPAEHIHEAPRYSPEAALALAAFAQPTAPVRAQATPGRNDPCTCGSGRKFKKCCGAPR